MPIDKYLFRLDMDVASETVKKYRRRIKKTQYDMAELMGLSSRSYQRFENMEGLPERGKFENFIRVTNCPREELYQLNEFQVPRVSDLNIKYNTEDADLNEIFRALTKDKALKKLVLNLVRHVVNLEDISNTK